MRKVTVDHWQMLRRLGQYLINSKQGGFLIEVKLNGRQLLDELKNYPDSDWRGDILAATKIGWHDRYVG